MVQKQVSWWVTNIRAAQQESKILDPRTHHKMDQVDIFTDAAGGNELKLKNGAGGFSPPEAWYYVPWSPLIRKNRENSEGVRFGSKLCCLEGYAALLGLVMVPDKVKNQEATIYCDNAGFVAVFKKRHSKCPYSYTMAKALNDVSKGLSCKLNVVKTRRCSGPAGIAADALSTGNWNTAWEKMPNKEIDPRKIPTILLKWLCNPFPDLSLGNRILSEMSRYTSVMCFE